MADRLWRQPWLAGFIAISCYANSLLGDFAYDDEYVIRTNPNIRSLANVRAIWLTDWWYFAGAEDGLTPDLRDPDRDRLYRPLTIFSFALNYAVHGLRPLGYHAVNVFLHGLVTLLVWRLAERLFHKPRVAGITALLFAVHPIHAEAVANVVGRAEILAALFLLAGLLFLLPRAGMPSPTRIIAGGAMGLAALLSKETAICFPLLAGIVLCWRALECRPLGQRLAIGTIAAIAILLPVVAYFVARYVALDGHFIRTSPPSWLFNPLVDAKFAGRVFLPLEIFGHYLRLMVAPVHLSCDYGLAIVRPDVFISIETLLGAAAVLAIPFALLRYRSAKAILLASLFVASYTLISNTVILIGVSLAERLFYWPSAIVLMAASLAIDGFLNRDMERIGSTMRLTAILGVSCVIALGLRAATRSADWASDSSLFTADAATWPTGAQLQQSLARISLIHAEQSQPGREREALLRRTEQLLDQALRVAPRYSMALKLRGLALAQRGENAAAVRSFEQALALEPTDGFSRRWLDHLRGGGSSSQRVELLERDITTRPADPQLWVQLIEARVATGDSAKALEHARTAHAAIPDDIAILRALGEVLALNLQRDEAIAMLREVLDRQPDDWTAHINLSALLAEQNAEQSLHHAESAARLRPADIRSEINLAAALALNRRMEDAIAHYRGILKRLPAGDPQRILIEGRVRELSRE